MSRHRESSFGQRRWYFCPPASGRLRGIDWHVRVLVIANNFPTPSAAYDGIYVLRQLEALSRLGHEFIVVRAAPHAPAFMRNWAYYRSFPASYETGGFPVQILRTLALPREALLPTYGRQLARRIAGVAKSFGAQLIHAQGTLPSGLLAACQDLPTVLTAHGTDTYDMPWRRAGMQTAARRAVAHASQTVGVSAFIADHLRRLGARDPLVVFNGADERIFAPRDRLQARRALHLPEEAAIVAFTGRLERWKGVFDLVEAVARLPMRPQIVACGDGKDRVELERTARERGVALHLLGAVGQDVVASAYAAADVFALPSHREGMPSVVAEAMLAGRAVVASNAGGTAEIVRDGETGIVHPIGDVDALAAGLARVLREPEFRESCERRAAAYAAAHLTWRANAARYDEIYREITGTRSPLRTDPRTMPAQGRS